MAPSDATSVVRYHALQTYAAELEHSAAGLPEDEAVQALRDALAARARMVEIANGGA